MSKMEDMERSMQGIRKDIKEIREDQIAGSELTKAVSKLSLATVVETESQGTTNGSTKVAKNELRNMLLNKFNSK